MSSDNKTKSNFKFIYMSSETNCLSCDYKLFEQLSQLAMDSAIPCKHVSKNTGVSIIMDNRGSTYELNICIRSEPFYKINLSKADKTCCWTHQCFMSEINRIIEIFQVQIEKSLFNEINMELNELFDLFSQNPKNTNLNKGIATNATATTNTSTTNNQLPENTNETQPPQYDLNKMYVKRTEDTTISHNIKFVVPDTYRQIMAKFGTERAKGIGRRCIDFNNAKIQIIILRKTKSKSVLRQLKGNDNLVLKIGTGVFHGTADDKNFEWRVPHTAENVKHIEDALINFNKWFEEKLKEEEKQKIENERKKKEEEEKQKIETESKKKEEEKWFELLQKENFIELK